MRRKLAMTGLGTMLAGALLAVSISIAATTPIELEVEGDSKGVLASFHGKIFANRDCRKNRGVTLFRVEEPKPELVSGTDTDKFGEYNIVVHREPAGKYFTKVRSEEHNGEDCLKGKSDPVTYTP